MKRYHLMQITLMTLMLLSSSYALADLTANTNGNTSQSSTPTTISDDTITRNVQTKLNADPTLNGVKIIVSTNNGVVTLGATVNTQVMANSIIATAKSVPGVKNVKSNITVNNAATTNSTDTENSMSY